VPPDRRLPELHIHLLIDVGQAGEDGFLFGHKLSRLQLALGGEVGGTLLFRFRLVLLYPTDFGLQTHIAHRNSAAEQGVAHFECQLFAGDRALQGIQKCGSAGAIAQQRPQQQHDGGQQNGAKAEAQARADFHIA